MARISRRSVLMGAAGLTATSLARPYIANAAATTATVWVNQGFVQQEDVAFKNLAADYMKESGNKLDYSILPFLAENQKTIAALTSGDVPDLIFMDAPATILPQAAWQDQVLDVSDVVAPHESGLSEATKLGATFYNKALKTRSYYLVPIKTGTIPFHIWGSLVEEAGYKVSEIPNTWDARWNFFKPMQKILRAKGMRKIYALGMEVETVGPNDGNGLFEHTWIANGGAGVVTPDGNLHADDAQVREAAIKTCTFLSSCYKEGYVPPEALSWNDADDNNGFHEKLFLIDFDGTISTELAEIDHKEDFYHNFVTLGMPLGNDGKPVPTLVGPGGGFIPKGAKNVAVAKDLMKYWMQPKVMNDNLKAGLGRYVPVIEQIVKDDKWWLNSGEPCLTPYVKELLGPTLPIYQSFNPAWGQVEAEQILQRTTADVVKNGLTPTAAVDKMLARAKQIFAQYTIG